MGRRRYGGRMYPVKLQHRVEARYIDLITAVAQRVFAANLSKDRINIRWNYLDWQFFVTIDRFELARGNWAHVRDEIRQFKEWKPGVDTPPRA